MSDTVECSIHGKSHPAYVCEHLAHDSVGLGFNRNEPTQEDPFPDAWCDDCEIIREAHGGWNEQSEKLAKIWLLCAGCYERSRIRNTRTSCTLDDLKTLRWKCSSCDDWHYGPCLDFGYDAPIYWKAEQDSRNGFLNDDFCVIEQRDYFVRGVIPLPIIGTNETFNWGVWGSLSKANFDKLVEMNEDPKRAELPPMFSWLSNQIAEYPDTLSLKMYAHLQSRNGRPHFELEETDHPLSQEFHHGIAPERVKQIMMGRPGGTEGQ